jgi:NAD(P)H dehydrogenase (quinone)
LQACEIPRLVYGRRRGRESTSPRGDQGANVVVGDLLDFRAVRRAFEEIKRAYFVYPMRPGLVQATAQCAQAALEAKAEFIVNMSQMTARPDALSDSALQHWLAERVFDRAGAPVTYLRPTAFTDTRLVGKAMSAMVARVPHSIVLPAAKITLA